jgi:hypothetical protein
VAERRSSLKRALFALLGAHLCFGAAQIAILPPWEGFDETAHFSSIQQIWDVGTIPRMPAARLSTVIADYSQAAPLPYSSVAPFDQNGGSTYTSLFQAGPPAVARATDAIHGLGSRRPFEAGGLENPAAQHPPLFYALLAPVYGLTNQLSLGGQLYALRFAAFLMAWLGLVAGVFVAARYAPTTTNPEVVTIVAALWPFLVPSWLPAMARLGNDALVALLIGSLWLWIVVRGTRDWPSALVIGVILGIGALTKPLFLPVAAGTFFWWLLQTGRAPFRDPTWQRMAVCAAIMAALAAWWYLGSSVVAVATSESAELERLGGLASALQQNFSWSGWLSGNIAFLGMLAWSGTWSLARPPHVLFVPLIAGLLLAACSYVLAIRHDSRGSLSWLPFWWLLPMLAGFSYHILVHVGLSGSGRGVGGYYLNVLVAPLAWAVGLGVAAQWTRSSVRVVFSGFLAYAMVFAAVASAAQALLFAGLLTKGPDKMYQATAAMSGGLGLPEVVDRLSVLAYPRLAAALALCGALLAVLGLIAAYRLAWPRRAADPVPAFGAAVAR